MKKRKPKPKAQPPATPDYSQLPPNIRATTRWIHACGLETTDSSDGTHNQTQGMPCAELWAGTPMVVIRAASPHDGITTATYLHSLLRSYNHPLPPDLGIDATYSPVDGVSLVVVSHLDDSWFRPHPEFQHLFRVPKRYWVSEAADDGRAK